MPDFPPRPVRCYPVASITGMRPGFLGKRPVLVCGSHPSSGPDTVPGAYVIMANPRRRGILYDAAVAYDPAWWEDHPERFEAALEEAGVVILPKRFGSHPIPIHPKIARAHMVPRDIPGIGLVHACRVRGRACGSGPVMAVLCALWMTRGDVLVTGCPLDGVDEKGNNYVQFQLEKWRRASRVFCGRVKAAPGMFGPLVDHDILKKG